MTVQATVLKDVSMVTLNISVWSGAKKLEPSDFINVDADDLPSDRVVSYGIKHLIEKERLLPFKSIRGQAERICAKYGSRLLLGYFVPKDCVNVIGEELSRLCVQFDQEIDKFMAQYDQSIEDWITAHPDFAGPLRRAMLPRSEVRSRFKASFCIFQINPTQEDGTHSMSNIGTELFDSVLNSVLATFKPLLERKSGATPDWFRVEVRQIIVEGAQKLRRFSFTDPIGGMIALANDLEASVAGSGKIHGAEFANLWRIISDLKTVEMFKQAVADRANRQDVQPPVNAAPLPLQPALPTIKDDLGFPLGAFDVDSDRGSDRDGGDVRNEEDAGFPAFGLSFDPNDDDLHQNSHPAPVEQARAAKPFNVSFDF